MRPIDSKLESDKFLGRLGENETRCLKFYVGDILNRFPDAQITVLNQRKGDAAAYPVADTRIEGDFVIWTIRSEDVAVAGNGYCELVATSNGKIIKTQKFETWTDESLDGSAQPPEPWQGWMDSVLQAAEDARDSAEESATNVTHYPKVENGYWIVWDAVNEQWVSTGIHAQGEQGIQGIQGEPGFTPVARVSKSGRTATITITDESGTTEAEISDGEDGVTPLASVSKVGKTATITIIDAEGSTEASITDGEDGFTPTASVSKVGKTATISITDAVGTTEATVTDGEDGVTPVASVAKVGDTATITIIDAEGTTEASVRDGADGFSPTATVTKTGKFATVRVTDAHGTTEAYINDGIDGADGYSPFAGVSKRGHTATVTIIDKRGLSEVEVYDGADGQPGPAGQDGHDGVSPAVSVDTITGGHTVTITDAQGDHAFNVMDGAPGQDGQPGAPGVDGYSPRASVSKSGNTATITITDEIGTTTATVTDGQDGAPGAGVASGGTTGQILVKKSSTDYDTEWTNFPADTVLDVQVNGSSVVNQGVANVPAASDNGSTYGVVKVNNSSCGVGISSAGVLYLPDTTETVVKAGTSKSRAIMPYNQHFSAFYGLAKAAGDSTQSSSSNFVGTYTDEAKAAIQAMLDVPSQEAIADKESATATAAHAIGELFLMGGKLYKAKTAIAIGDAIVISGASANAEQTNIAEEIPTVPVQDVQVNGASVLSQGVANVPLATNTVPGVVKTGVEVTPGVYIDCGIQSYSGGLIISKADSSIIKTGTNNFKPIVSSTQHEAAFYGLPKAAGDSTQASSDNAVGTYTENAKSAIHDMLNAPVTVSGSTPSITGKSGIRYICGEVVTLSITPPASGDCEVIFTSGSTATVLTVPNTVKFPEWFDATSLEANRVYDIIITNATYGVVTSWAS